MSLNKHLMTISMLRYNASKWKTRCNYKYESFRFLIDVNEYYLWRFHNIPTPIKDFDETILKINNLGKILHNRKEDYILSNKGNVYFKSMYMKNEIKILNDTNIHYNRIHFPINYKKNISKCFLSANDMYYLKMLIQFLNK